jgi:nucleotide-binding universal stress UspA family protein
MDGQQPAWESPPLLAAVRRGVPQHVLTSARSAADGGLAASTAGRLRRFAVRGGGGRPGPVVFGYDGSELAKTAIAEAGRQLSGHRDALVLTVWRTFSVGFVPEPGAQFDAARSDQVREAGEQTAARGAALAEAAGFRAHAMAVEGTPVWKAIVDAADDRHASLIVLGSRGRAGLGGLVAGSVAGAVAARSRGPVLIVHDEASAPNASGPSSSQTVRDELPH